MWNIARGSSRPFGKDSLDEREKKFHISSTFTCCAFGTLRLAQSTHFPPSSSRARPRKSLLKVFDFYQLGGGRRERRQRMRRKIQLTIVLCARCAVISSRESIDGKYIKFTASTAAVWVDDEHCQKMCRGLKWRWSVGLENCNQSFFHHYFVISIRLLWRPLLPVAMRSLPAQRLCSHF